MGWVTSMWQGTQREQCDRRKSSDLGEALVCECSTYQGSPPLHLPLPCRGAGTSPPPSLSMQRDGQLSSTLLQMVTGPAGSFWGREGVQFSVIGRGGVCRTGMSKAGKPCSHLLMRQLVRQGLQPAAREGCVRVFGLGVFWKEPPRQREYQDKGWGAGANWA